ncbi:TetR/AcrR family transcriptional regulator [Pseudonocardia sp. CA-107938]|uniref:TetR/AcrR family transcriptional regulator n=1 Tax=Pseudonocardia sp. CA-107938 TaxID=3240021 RepID=UPI003D94A259
MEDGVIVRIDGVSAPTATDRKRAAIVEAATRRFLRQGYDATRIDQIAADAAASKQTVYNQFGDKEALFRQVVLGATATAEAFAAALPASFDDVPDAAVPDALRALARRYLATTAAPQVLALRRLVVGEATRFPKLAATYHERAPALVMAAFAELFARLGARGVLRVPDPAEAAQHFAFLVVGPAIDRGMLLVDVEAPGPATVRRTADRAVEVFLAGYRR